MNENRRPARRRRKRGRANFAGVFVLFLLTVGILYVAYIGVKEGGTFLTGLFVNREAAPVTALADETDTLSVSVSGADTAEGSGLSLTALQDGPQAYAPAEDGPPPTPTPQPTEEIMNPYAAFSFYIAENQAEYERYSDENPLYTK